MIFYLEKLHLANFICGETLFGELHLTKVHLAKIGYTNPFPGFARFYTGYASGIDFFKRLDRHTHKQTNTHLRNYIIDLIGLIY